MRAVLIKAGGEPGVRTGAGVVGLIEIIRKAAVRIKYLNFNGLKAAGRPLAVPRSRGVPQEHDRGASGGVAGSSEGRCKERASNRIHLCRPLKWMKCAASVPASMSDE